MTCKSVGIHALMYTRIISKKVPDMPFLSLWKATKGGITNGLFNWQLSTRNLFQNIQILHYSKAGERPNYKRFTGTF